MKKDYFDNDRLAPWNQQDAPEMECPCCGEIMESHENGFYGKFKFYTHICSECGNPSEKQDNNRGWIYTMCNKCKENK